MNIETYLMILFVVVVIARVTMRRIRRAWLARQQLAELKVARDRKSTAGTIRRMQARHAFERGENTQGVMLLKREEPDS